VIKLACAKDIMTKEIITLKETATAKDAIHLILDKRISGIPVVKNDMTLIGIITEKDLLQCCFFDSGDEVKLTDIMTTDVFTMNEDTDLFEINDFFMNHNYKRLPIVKDNKLIGIISRKDMLRYILKK
jgi:CBS domain-containing protein